MLGSQTGHCHVSWTTSHVTDLDGSCRDGSGQTDLGICLRQTSGFADSLGGEGRRGISVFVNLGKSLPVSSDRPVTKSELEVHL